MEQPRPRLPAIASDAVAAERRLRMMGAEVMCVERRPAGGDDQLVEVPIDRFNLVFGDESASDDGLVGGAD